MVETVMSTTDWQRNIVIVVGAPRSGTTWLARSLAEEMGASYMEEPNWLWRFGNLHRSTDFLTTNDLTPKLIQGIRRRFMAQLSKSEWLVEKTPANVVRRDFVRLILPKARFILVTRNWDEVERSLMNKTAGGEDSNYQRLEQSRIATYTRTVRNLLRYSKITELPIGIGELIGRACEKAKGRMLLAPRSPDLCEIARNSGLAAAVGRQMIAIKAGLRQWMQYEQTCSDGKIVTFEEWAEDPGSAKQLANWLR